MGVTEFEACTCRSASSNSSPTSPDAHSPVSTVSTRPVELLGWLCEGSCCCSARSVCELAWPSSRIAGSVDPSARLSYGQRLIPSSLHARLSAVSEIPCSEPAVSLLSAVGRVQDRTEAIHQGVRGISLAEREERRDVLVCEVADGLLGFVEELGGGAARNDASNEGWGSCRLRSCSSRGRIHRKD
eukprot:637995-Hanusia_phi.AAC.2